MLITISGKAWSWKWTISKMLTKKLWYKYISVWNIKRELAKKMWISIEEFNILWEKPENVKNFDLKYEEFQKNLSLNDNILLDSRLGFFCQPKAFKIYLDVDIDEAVNRIFSDKRESEKYSSKTELKKKLIARNENDRKRFLNLYKIDYFDKKNFDLVINTTNLTPEKILEKIIIEFNNFKKI